MKKLVFATPESKRKFKALKITFLALTLGYIALSVIFSLYVAIVDSSGWGLFFFAFAMLNGMFFLILFLAAANFARYCIFSRDSGVNIPEPKIDRTASVCSLIFASVAIVFAFASELIDSSYIREPLSFLTLTSKIRAFAFAFLIFSVASLAINAAAQFFITLSRKYRKIGAKAARTEKLIKRVAYILACIIIATVLFVPYGKARYNDGGGVHEHGSVYYEAVMYDIIVWDRTHEFDKTPRPYEKQQTRIYFFPFSCYSYTGKWELKH